MYKEVRRIINLIKEKTDLSQKDIAEKMGVHPNILSDLANGRKSETYTAKFLEQLKNTFDLPEEVTMVTDGIPFYEVENFECGTPAGFGGALESTNPDGYFNFPWVKPDGNTFCVKAHGNSMLNTKDPIHSINHGSFVALKHNEVNTIQWGEVYALATANGYIIKKLMPSEREGYVKCVSFNSEEFPPYDLDVNEIYDYAIVVGVATINLW